MAAETRIVIADQVVVGELLPPEAPTRRAMPEDTLGILLLDPEGQPLGFAPLRAGSQLAVHGDLEDPTYERVATGAWRVDWTVPQGLRRALPAYAPPDARHALARPDPDAWCRSCDHAWARHDEWGCTLCGEACRVPRPPDPRAIRIAGFVVGSAAGVQLAGRFETPIHVLPGHRWSFALSLDPPATRALTAPGPNRLIEP